MLRFFAPALALLTVTVLTLAAASTARAADAVDAYLRAEMARNHIPGIAVAVVRDGKVIKLTAYGSADLEQDTPVTPHTAFQLASATKPLTGTALLLLAQEGKLSLDDLVGRHLPEAPEAWKAVTLRHLADHTSGIPDDLGAAGATAHSAADVVTAAAALPLAHEPGARSSYGLTGYVVLQRVIERVSGRPFEAFLRERVLAPLGMRDTRFDNAAPAGPAQRRDLVPHRAGVYDWDPAAGRQSAFAFPFPSHGYTAGGLYSSAADLARWAVALDRAELLTAASRERMWTPARLGDGTSAPFAAGWAVGTYRGRRTAGHSGGPALADVLRFVDDGLTVIVLANQQRMYPYLAQGVADLYVSAPASRAAEASRARAAATRPAPGVEDASPATTRSLLGLLTGFAEGRVDPAGFAPPVREQMPGMVERFALPYLKALGRPWALTLLEDRPATGAGGPERTRRYRAWYGRDKPVVWRFDLDAEGKVLNLAPTPE